MSVIKCCVNGCNATSATHKLFTFPKNDYLRNLWMSFLVPINSLLIGLSKEQLLRKRVCEKHFDKHQFDKKGKRLRFSYPCLFTDGEITCGEPLLSARIGQLSDHNYYKAQSDDDDEVDDSLLVIRKAGDNLNEHPSCSYSQPISSVTDAVSEESLDSSIQIEVPSTCAHTANKPNPLRKVKTVQAQVPVSSKKNFFIKKVTKIASKSSGLTRSQRIVKAIAYSNNGQLFKNFKFLSKQAQTFLLMQLRLCRQNKMARRFSIEEKLQCLVLLKQSPKSYKLLESMFTLPNKRTLHQLSEKISVEPGLNPKIFEFIRNKIKKWSTHQKLCSIIFDEISLTSHLTYNEKNDKIHGFVDVAGERKMKFCDHVLVFMIRGVCSSWRQTIAFYFCEGSIPAAALQNILKKLVPEIAQTGLIPLGLVCDQGSTFRTAIKAIKDNTVRRRILENEKDDGSINIAGHNLSVFFDPPHLLKGLRNNFLNKDIIWEGKRASWKDIQFIFDLDSKLGCTRALPKLTSHHVNPDKIKKMKVSVAAQVFSQRTADMLKYTNALNNLHTGNEGTSSMETTAQVVEFFDQLFDSVNCNPGGSARGKLRKAVKKNSLHHQFWIEAIKKIKDLKYEDSRSKIAIQAGKSRLVRVPSLEGWITTLESFLRISKLLFNKYSIQYFYPRLINQDPLENFFGRLRALNYRNIKPDTNTFLYSYKSLLLSNFLSPHSKFANCEVDEGETLLDFNILFQDLSNENENLNTIGTHSTSQEHERVYPRSPSGSLAKDDAVLEKIKVQCSAYTAGFICRKMTKEIQCKNCLKTYTSSSTDDKIYSYIKYREFTMLKNNNLAYPTERLLIMYRDASSLVHSYLNKNGYKENLSKNIAVIFNNFLRFSCLGCSPTHNKVLKKSFIKNIIRLHAHNWCNILNKILKGDIEKQYVSKVSIQQCAYRKYKTSRLRKKQ